MQTPSPRAKILAAVCAGLALALTFFLVTNHAHHTAASKIIGQPAPKSASAVAASAKNNWLRAYGQIPLSFESNEGQSAAGVQFLSRDNGYELSLLSQEADFTFHPPISGSRNGLDRSNPTRNRRVHGAHEGSSVLRMHLDGANPTAAITGADRTATKINYFIGNDPKKWHTDVPAYAKVKYADVYPGIDLVFYGNRSELEYDFVVGPGANAKEIALNIEGATKLRLDASGNLRLGVANGEVKIKKPNAYQELNGIRREVAGNFKIANHHEVRFALADYDQTQPLTIDPVVTYSTYVGGSGSANGGDMATGIALDSAGDAYIGGITFSADLLQVNPLSATVPAAVTGGNSTGFVAELNPTGTAALYLAYLGGETLDGIQAIAVDANKNIYVTGFTESTQFPLNSTNTGFETIPPASVNAGGSGFVTRLNPALTGIAQLVYSSYIGGSGPLDQGNGIAVDGSGDAFVTGVTQSATGFPTANAGVAPFSATQLSTNGNAFVTEVNTGVSGTSSLLFSSYFGGTGGAAGLFPFGDYGAAITIDSNNNAYVVGTTSTGGSFPTQGTQIDSCAKNSDSAAFVAEIGLGTPTTPVLTYSTCLTGSTADLGVAVALGPNNLVYLTGAAFSADFPTTANTIPLAFPNTPPAGIPNSITSVAFVSTVNTATGALGYSTLLGGNGGDGGDGIGVDSQGVAYVTGQTDSPDFPITPGALQTILSNPRGNTFVSKINASAGGQGGADLLYSTFYGGTGDPNGDLDAGNAIAVSGTNAYVAGQATKGLQTTAGAYHTTTNNLTGLNAFVADLPLVPNLSVTPTTLAFGTQLLNVTSAPPMTVTLVNNSSGTLTIPFTVIGANAGDFMATSGAAMGCAGNLAAGASCTIDVVFTPTLLPAGAEAATLQIANSLNPTQPFLVALTGTSSATADFSLTVPATASLMSGVAGSIPITVNGIGGLTDPVTLSCTAGTMNVSSCTVSPTSVAPGGTATASVTATISFVAPPATIKTPPPASIRQVVFLILGISMLFMIPMTKRFRTRMGMAAAMLVFIAVAGCSGSPSSHTSSGSVTITGTGTGAAAGITHSATVNLTISK
jgi:hypothetical protein